MTQIFDPGSIPHLRDIHDEWKRWGSKVMSSLHPDQHPQTSRGCPQHRITATKLICKVGQYGVIDTSLCRCQQQKSNTSTVCWSFEKRSIIVTSGDVTTVTQRSEDRWAQSRCFHDNWPWKLQPLSGVRGWLTPKQPNFWPTKQIISNLDISSSINRAQGPVESVRSVWASTKHKQ